MSKPLINEVGHARSFQFIASTGAVVSLTETAMPVSENGETFTHEIAFELKSDHPLADNIVKTDRLIFFKESLSAVKEMIEQMQLPVEVSDE